MTTPFCPDCEADVGSLGQPSHARWQGPDGNVYCSMHLISRFGHAEKLVPIRDYTPPKESKPPAPKKQTKGRRSSKRKVEEVTDG